MSGRPIPRHRFAFLRPGVEGNFSLREQFDNDLQRRVLFAKLEDAQSRQELFPALYDAVVTFAEGERMTVRGVERDSMTRKMTAQAWLLELMTARPQQNPARGDASAALQET